MTTMMTAVEPSNSPSGSSSSSQQQVKSTGGGGGGLWKRFGRRGSKSSASVNSATSSTNINNNNSSSNNNDDSKNNAEQSLAAKRAQRIMAGGPGPGLGGGANDNSSSSSNNNNNNSSRRGRSRSRESSSQHSRGIFGKIRDSVRGQRSISVGGGGGGDEDGNGNESGNGKVGPPTRMSASKKRSNSRRGGARRKSSGRKNQQLPPSSSEALRGQHSLNSPSYSTDSYQTVESDLEEKKEAFDWNEVVGERQKQDYIYRKQQFKERDGFCRRVDTYDGQVIVVDQKATYEIGNYLGGGVAGVVYEGHRLRPMEEYPVRTGNADQDKRTAAAAEEDNEQKIATVLSADVEDGGFFCGISSSNNAFGAAEQQINKASDEAKKDATGGDTKPDSNGGGAQPQLLEEIAIEATVTYDEKGGVMLDAQDAPSRSRHYTDAAAVPLKHRARDKKPLIPGLPDETVAIKILNPVGYRILQADSLKDCVVVKKGDPMDNDVKRGLKPMEERHVWWLVNPNSRNLRTLQRYNGDGASVVSAGLKIDRGSEKKGLRLSLIASYVDPRTGDLRELTLTRCIEIWGHIPFNATDIEFEDMMLAIERVNAGHPPPPVPAFDDNVPGRIGTDETNPSKSSDPDNSLPFTPLEFAKNRTGLMRAAVSERATVNCKSLNAYIAIPAVPSKYLRWLRQRRAATKEIRNMMLIGRHKNVLHLFEVLEYIQDSKSTMFLVLELVKGGELFDLISSSAGKGPRSAQDLEESETRMRRFFFELASGIQYCHSSGIAHRDLKPENLLVHTGGAASEGTLKIADFGLSAVFGPAVNQKSAVGAAVNDSVAGSLGSPLSHGAPDDDNSFGVRDGNLSPSSQATARSVKGSVDRAIASGVSALSFLTCGAMENVLCIPNVPAVGESPFRRMTSVVGSPHYVAPEIISQTDEKTGEKKRGCGYDGSKADVWSAGVILYAMLFRSLPFGEDLLRCPRYQSYRKWYDEVRKLNGRRSSSQAALNPHISEVDEQDYLGPHWFFPATTSAESRDLVVAMLNPRPVDRLSISQVLQHPWIQPEKDSIVATS